MSISIVITTHNEGRELRRTIKSIRKNTRRLHEIIVVDDGSTDGHCCGLEEQDVTVIRHDTRVGVAISRHEATQTATGSVVAYLDGHQRVSRHCLDRVAEVALEQRAIVSVDACNFTFLATIAHGAEFQLCPQRGYFSARWRHKRPRATISRVSSLKAPAYALPLSIYDKIHWIESLRGWGGSEAAISLKAFFAGVDILHLRGPVAKHRFRQAFPYVTTWEEVWRNQALIARVCFDDRTWYDYWLPQVFDKHLSKQAHDDLESDSVVEEAPGLHGEQIQKRQRFLVPTARRSASFMPTTVTPLIFTAATANCEALNLLPVDGLQFGSRPVSEKSTRSPDRIPTGPSPWGGPARVADPALRLSEN